MQMEILPLSIGIIVLGASLFAIVTMAKKISALRLSVLESSQREAELQNKNTLAEQSAQEVSTSLSALKSTVSSLEEELSTVRNEHEIKNSEVIIQQKRVDALQQQLHEVEQQKQLLTEQFQNTQKEVLELKEQLRKEISSHSSTESVLQNTEEQLQAKIEAMELFAADQKEFIKKLEVQNTEKEQSLLQLRNTVHALTTDSETASTELQSTIGDLHQTIERLQQKISSQQATIEHVQLTYNHEMSARLGVEQSSGVLQETIAQLHSEINSLKLHLIEEQSSHQATEAALQESKDRLYGVIRELELRVSEEQHRYSVEQERVKELRLHAERLQTHYERLDESIREVVSKAPLGCCLVDSAGAILDVNEILCALYNSPKELLLGKNFTDFFPLEDRAFYREQWNNQEKNRAEQFHGDAVLSSASGEHITVYFELVPISHTTEMRYLGFFLDKTKEVEAETHLKIATERETELNDLKSRFISMVTHQLRNSLVTIASNTELLERFIDKWSAERRYQAFYRINESLKEMKDILHDVVFTTNVTAGKISFSPTACNLEELAQAVAKQVQQEMEVHHRFLFIEQGTLNAIRLDEKLMTTILQNLLSNAFKYSPDGSDIILRAERKENVCTLIVEDHGIGIPANDQPQIFGTFFRGSNVGSTFGTGLGLTIVQQCVQLHNGTLAIESELNKGTKTIVTIPIEE